MTNEAARILGRLGGKKTAKGRTKAQRYAAAEKAWQARSANAAARRAQKGK